MDYQHHTVCDYEHVPQFISSVPTVHKSVRLHFHFFKKIFHTVASASLGAECLNGILTSRKL